MSNGKNEKDTDGLVPKPGEEGSDDPSIAIRALFDSLGPLVVQMNEHQMRTLDKQQEIATVQSAANLAHIAAQRELAATALHEHHEREVADQLGRRRVVWGVLVLCAAVSVSLAVTDNSAAVITVIAVLGGLIGVVMNKSGGASPPPPPMG